MVGASQFNRYHDWNRCPSFRVPIHPCQLALPFPKSLRLIMEKAHRSMSALDRVFLVGKAKTGRSPNRSRDSFNL